MSPRPPTLRGPDQRWSLAVWALLTVLCLALFLDGLDVTMVAVALPSIGADIGLSTAQLTWIVNGYVLGFGGLLLLGGRMADLLGRRKVFLIALGVFAFASFLGGVVDSGWLIILTRFVKGAAAAFTAPTGLSIITTTFPEGRHRNRALAIYTMFGASGFSSGLIFGGLMMGIGWRWTFLFPVPIAIAALIVGAMLIPKDRPAVTDGSYDFAGAVTLTSAMMLLVYTVVSAPETGWFTPLTLALFAGVIVLLAAFVTIERKVAHPLVRLGILRNLPLLSANLGFITLLGSYAGFQFLVTLYFQQALGWSPLALALALLPVGLLVVIGAPIVGGLIGRFGTPPLVIVGLLSLGTGLLLFLRVDTDPSYVVAILPTTVLVGIAFSLIFPSVSVQATAGVADHEQGLAAGLLQTSGQVGSAVVLALTMAVISLGGATTTAGEPSAEQVLEQFRPGLVFVACAAFVGLVLFSAMVWMSRRAANKQPQEDPDSTVAATEA